MNKFFKIFILAFIIAFIVGFLIRKQEKYESKSILDFITEKSIILNFHIKTEKEYKKYTKIFLPNGKGNYFFMYDIDSNRVSSDTLTQEKLNVIIGKKGIDRALIFLGASGGLLGLCNLAILSKLWKSSESGSEKVKIVSAYVLGTLTGFGLGYTLGKDEVDFGDEQIREEFANLKNWSLLKNMIIENKYEKLGNYVAKVMSSLDKNKADEIYDIQQIGVNTFRRYKNRDINYEPQSKDFLFLEECANKIDSISNLHLGSFSAMKMCSYEKEFYIYF